MSSPLVGRSTLAGSFRQTRGFAVTFTRAGLPALTQRFPELRPYLERVLDDQLALASFTERLRGRPPHPEPNAFYLNLLLVQGGGSVGRHTDATLRGPSGEEHVVPVRVSVLYLSVPARMRGGELRLYRNDRPVAVVSPREGALVHFRGDLQHEVSTVENEGDLTVASSGAQSGAPDVMPGLRASLVCEQYALPDAALARVPELQIQSRAGFAAYLDDHARRGTPSST